MEPLPLLLGASMRRLPETSRTLAAVSGRTQPYHHGNLRAVLVDVAVELVRSRGSDGVVLREVARRAGVSHNAAYRHFDDRAALLAEVSNSAMADLEGEMKERIDAVEIEDPVARAIERLRETGRAYVGFALREPGLFAVAFTSLAGPAAHEASNRPTGPYALLNGALEELVERGVLPPERREGAAVACWALVHGFAELHLDGPLREIPAETRARMLENVFDIIQPGLVG
jgi:AcrR family transcriptional regulator